MASRPVSAAGDARLVAVRAAESISLIGLAVRLAWNASPRILLGLLALVLLEAGLPLAQLGLAKAVLDRLAGGAPAAPLSGPGTPVGSPQGWLDTLPFGGVVGLAVLVVGVSQLLPTLSATLVAIAGDRITGHVTGRLIRAANGWRGLARFEDPGFADDLFRARERTTLAGLDLVREGTAGVTDLVAAAGLAATLGTLHPLAPLLVVAGSLPQVVWQWGYLQATANSLYIRTPATRRLRYFREVSLDPEPAQDVRLYGLAPTFGERYGAVFRSAVDAMLPLYRALTARSALGVTLGALVVGVVYVSVVWRAVAQGSPDRLTAGDVVLYGGGAAMLHDRLLDAGRMVGVLPRSLAFLPALQRVLHAPPDLPTPAHPLPAPRPIREGIVFHDVWFAYPGRPAASGGSAEQETAGPPVLRGVSLAIRPGESLALAGRNGSGKTTLVKLLLRLYDPTAGSITLDGADLRDYDLEALRRRMGVIFQDFVHYELTARENVATGDLTALDDDARLLAAAGKAGAGGLIRGLPAGLETRLGRRFGGRDLSGGEWQKLALARALVRDCDLLVLDEPTASLDAQTEYDVYRRFRALTRGRMTLLISHRFSTVRLAGRILYLDGGRIAEEGTHGDLLRADGEYARLFLLQASQLLDAEARAGAGAGSGAGPESGR